MLDIEKIKERVARATPGPWCKTDQWITDYEGHPYAHTHTGEDDADFIAHARQDIPDLIAEVERLEKQLAESRRREEAAVADLWRTPGIWPCFACKHTGQMSDRCRIDSRDCFDWRGPQTGKGENQE